MLVGWFVYGELGCLLVVLILYVISVLMLNVVVIGCVMNLLVVVMM